MNIQQMMKQAQQMQERLQKQMAELKVEATAGGGMVTVVVNGAVQSITIDPEVVSRDDVEMLQDLIVAAINDAQRKADEQMAQTMGGMMGGLKRSITHSTATAVSAASTALPPARSTSTAARVASGCEVAAMPSARDHGRTARKIEIATHGMPQAGQPLSGGNSFRSTLDIALKAHLQ